MVHEFAGEILAPVFRSIFWLFWDCFAEIGVRLMGYIVCRPFSRNVRFDDDAVAVVGFIVWVLVLLVVISGARHDDDCPRGGKAACTVPASPATTE